MDSAILSSTLLLTLLMFVGQFFFIRASTKDRTETARLISDEDEATLLPKLKEYFRTRSYQVTSVDAEHNQVFFEGFVRPSAFLAAFLTLLGAVGSLCLALVLSMVLAIPKFYLLGLAFLSPLIGIFYWKKAKRLEKVSLKVESPDGESSSSSQITVIAHRDELIEMRRALRLRLCD